MLKIEFRAMGCQMAAFVDNESSQAARALEQVPSWFEEWEQVLSRFRPDSELCALNTRPGDVFRSGKVLFEVVKTALEAARASSGIVLPTLLAPLVRAGYDRSFDLIGAAGDDSSAQPLLCQAAAWQDIRLDSNGQDIHLPSGVTLDLGGVAKGWAAHRASRLLGSYGPALVDAGGDIAISSGRAGGSPWAVAVADPLQASAQLAVLGLGGCGVATSGINHRRWRKAGRWGHHIIDPRTLEPVQTDLVSVTVVADDVVQAEMSAKVVLILGGKAGLEWLDSQGKAAALLAYKDGRVEYGRAIADFILDRSELV